MKMMDRISKGLLQIVALWTAAALGVAGAAEKGTLVSMGAVSGAPKNQVMVPLYLTPVPSETQVGSISATIRVDGNGVSFQKAEKSFLLDGVNAGFELRSEKDPSDANRLLLHVEISTKGEPRKSLREGLVLSLIFRIEPEASPGTKIPVVFEKLAATDLSTPAKTIDPLTGQQGTIEVLSPDQVPFVACFFFAH